jgi:hypothetical protein
VLVIYQARRLNKKGVWRRRSCQKVVERIVRCLELRAIRAQDRISRQAAARQQAELRSILRNLVLRCVIDACAQRR